MRIVDSHFHWWPRSIFERLCDRKTYPKAERDGQGGYRYARLDGAVSRLNATTEWLDLDQQFAHMDGLGRRTIAAVGSIGPFSVSFSDMPVDEGRDLAMQWNTEMAAAQRKYPGRFWATAAVPLVDTTVALEVMDHAINELGLVGVNLPGSVGSDPNIDAPRLEPFYDRAEQLDVPLMLHPTDAVFPEMMGGYGGALYLSLGRVIEVSVAASRLIFSGIMERHPNLKLVMSHTGGALPYQAGRLDKNGKAAKLPLPPSEYLKRIYTDTVSPHSMGIKFAVDFFGADHIMYGSDYPCWSPAEALRLFDAIDLSKEDQEKILGGNVRRLMKLREPALA
jgi:aminocarboxymuconate-semialdehyde decarboxylase